MNKSKSQAGFHKKRRREASWMWISLCGCWTSKFAYRQYKLILNFVFYGFFFMVEKSKLVTLLSVRTVKRKGVESSKEKTQIM